MIEESKEIEIKQLDDKESNQSWMSIPDINLNASRKESKYLSRIQSYDNSFFIMNNPMKINKLSSKSITRIPHRIFKNSHKLNPESPLSVYSNNFRWNLSRHFNSEGVKIPESLYSKWGCASLLIVDDQIINRLILNEFGKFSYYMH